MVVGQMAEFLEILAVRFRDRAVPKLHAPHGGINCSMLQLQYRDLSS